MKIKFSTSLFLVLLFQSLLETVACSKWFETEENLLSPLLSSRKSVFLFLFFLLNDPDVAGCLVELSLRCCCVPFQGPRRARSTYITTTKAKNNRTKTLFSSCRIGEVAFLLFYSMYSQVGHCLTMSKIKFEQRFS